VDCYYSEGRIESGLRDFATENPPCKYLAELLLADPPLAGADERSAAGAVGLSSSPVGSDAQDGQT